MQTGSVEILHCKVAEWLMALDCKSSLFGVRGFESLPYNKTILYHLDNILRKIKKPNLIPVTIKRQNIKDSIQQLKIVMVTENKRNLLFGFYHRFKYWRNG